MNFLLFCLAAIGFCHIIIDGSISVRPKAWLKKKLPADIYSIFECYQCCGFWTGVISGLVLLNFIPEQIYSKNLTIYILQHVLQATLLFLQAILFGCAGSFLSVFGANLLNVMEAMTIIRYKDKDENEE